MTPIKPMYAKVKALPMCVASAMAVSTVFAEHVYAEQVFNTAFLTDGLSNAQIADLSKLQSSQQQLPGVYRVEIYANDEYVLTRDIQFIEKQNAQDNTGLVPCLDVKLLESFGVNTSAYPELMRAQESTCLDISQAIEGANSRFQFSKQKLYIDLPQIALKNQVRGYIPPEQWDAGINAMFLNYRLSGYNNSGSATAGKGLYLSVDSGLNLGSWQLRHSGSFNYNSDDNFSNHEWTSLNTYLQKTLIPIKSQLRIGDGATDGSVFDSFGYRGVELSTADAMYPDSQQGYAPNVRGVAKSNAKVVIRQNNNIVYQINVAPGPFLIQDLNPAFGSGDLHVSVEESDGSVQSYLVPYSSLPILQREGRTRYSVLAGEFRNGLRSDRGNDTVVQATIVHGLDKGLSIYGGSQLSNHYQSGLIGFGSNMGKFGAFSFDLTHAKSELVDGSKHSGQSMRFLYSKSLLRSGTSFQLLGYRYSTRGFYTLNDVFYGQMSDNYGKAETQDGNLATVGITANGYDLNHTKKGRLQANISHSMGQYGSVYFAANQQSYWGTSKKDEWVQAGYNGAWNGVSYSLGVSRNMFSQLEKANTMYTANISFPLDRLRSKANFHNSTWGNTYATASTTQNSDGNNAYLVGINGTLLKDRNLNYSIRQGYVTEQGSAGSINANYNGTYGNIGAGYSYDGNNNRFSYSATGGMLLHKDGLTFGQTLGDTSILVKAPGAKGVKVENYNGVKTDWRGYAILPYASEYRLNRVALDSNSFDSNLEINSNVSHVVPIRGAIGRATFDTSIGVRALINIQYKGQPIPYASNVTVTGGKASGMAAEFGQVYMTGLPLKGVLEIAWGETTEQKCVADYDIGTADLSLAIQQFNVECK
ncbi:MULTISPECIES: fimbria/pilus outer membrane usher protein [unclassified Acinetobacter]|uniref:fimbria/pilus outer membrane usher protein n=1 Tax=unclassified Acinetobacter TaxID=196816 RepID=UPI0018A92577|nr:MULTISPECIES: fimbria/pilus outer membrane usher protein [unclassified Acinetobacter]MBJ9955050.1 fimbria/pilus outer membrane usher protein [Acinetobacter baumannii]